MTLEGVRFVIEAFRGCALDSREGVIAFCRAFCELFETTGEAPQPDLFDEELLGALESRLPGLSIYDYCLALWLLNLSSHRRFESSPAIITADEPRKTGR